MGSKMKTAKGEEAKKDKGKRVSSRIRTIKRWGGDATRAGNDRDGGKG